MASVKITGIKLGSLTPGSSFTRIEGADLALIPRHLHGLDLLPSEVATLGLAQDSKITIILEADTSGDYAEVKEVQD